jgi:hypothetical protein
MGENQREAWGPSNESEDLGKLRTIKEREKTTVPFCFAFLGLIFRYIKSEYILES